MAKKGEKSGMSSKELRKMIVDLFHFISSEELMKLKEELSEYLGSTSSHPRPWEKDDLTPDDVLTIPEKMALLGIPGEANPFTGRGKDGTTIPKKINVIKMIRERLPYGLKQSKDLVDLYEQGVEEGIYTAPEGDEIEEAAEPSSKSDFLMDGAVDLGSLGEEAF